MGYETRLYIVEKSTSPSIYDKNKGKVWGDVIAMFDLRKCYSLSDRLRNCPSTNCYIFAEDGDTEIVEDLYGEPLKEATIEQAILYINKAWEETEYRRLLPVSAFLNTIQAQKEAGKWGELAVLHYGY